MMKKVFFGIVLICGLILVGILEELPTEVNPPEPHESYWQEEAIHDYRLSHPEEVERASREYDLNHSKKNPSF